MSLIKLENLLKSLDFSELKKAKKLVNDYYKNKKEKISSKKLVDTYVNDHGIYFRLEKVYCNKDNCNKCKRNEGHGPYWYSYKNGKREYIGKKSKNQLEEIEKNLNFILTKKQNNLPYKR